VMAVEVSMGLAMARLIVIAILWGFGVNCNVYRTIWLYLISPYRTARSSISGVCVGINMIKELKNTGWVWHFKIEDGTSYPRCLQS
jgi:hypothetical protein